MMYAMNSQQAERGICTYFRLLIVYQEEMNEGAEEPTGKATAALIICHIQIDMTTLNQAFFLVMMGNLDTAFKMHQYVVEVI